MIHLKKINDCYTHAIWFYKFIQKYDPKNVPEEFIKNIPIAGDEEIENYYDETADDWAAFMWCEDYIYYLSLFSTVNCYEINEFNMLTDERGVYKIVITHQSAKDANEIWDKYASDASIDIACYKEFQDIYTKAYDYINNGVARCNDYIEIYNHYDKKRKIDGITILLHDYFNWDQLISVIYYIYNYIHTLEKAVNYAKNTFAKSNVGEAKIA